MTNLCSKVICCLRGKTLVTAESCTGGGIGEALTAVPGSSTVFKGGIISYTNWVKQNLLNVPELTLEKEGAVSASVAKHMAIGVLERLQADVAVSVTGLAGPDGDSYGNPVGTVYIGYADRSGADVLRCSFSGGRNEIRKAAVEAALKFVLQHNS